MAKPFDISKFRKSITKSIGRLGFGINDLSAVNLFKSKSKIKTRVN